MAEEVSTGYCKVCAKQTKIARPGTNHILHLILTVITFGIWSVIWLLSAIKIGGWRCATCGARVSRKPFS